MVVLIRNKNQAKIISVEAGNVCGQMYLAINIFNI